MTTAMTDVGEPIVITAGVADLVVGKCIGDTQSLPCTPPCCEDLWQQLLLETLEPKVLNSVHGVGV